MYRIHTHVVLGLAGLALMFLVPPLVGQETPPSSQPAYLRVRIPAGAELLVDGTRTKQNGSERLFQSPPIPVGKKFLYSLKATWKEGGKEVVHEEVARVEAGKETFIDLRQSSVSKNGKTAETPSKKEETGRGTVTEPKTEEKVPPPDVTPPKKEAGEPGKPKREPDIFFLPTPQEVVNRMLELADIKKDDVVYDLGCGDGRIVVTAAEKYGVKAMGFDIDPARVKESLEKVKKHHVEKLVNILEADIFELDLTKATVVTLYLLPNLNEQLMPQLAKLRPGSRIVSHDFPMDGAKPVKKERLKVKNDRGEDSEHTVYLWIVPWEKEK
jgi:uncharacterized protein (TIGR03000 family)